MRREPEATARDARLLHMGRQFRLPSGAKAIVGRDKSDNERIALAALPDETLIASDITPGPTALVVGQRGDDDVEIAARICASFSDSKGDPVDMFLRRAGCEDRIKAIPQPRSEFVSIRIV